ncbi:Plasmodium exported protein, unknown function [Plasmodium vivax]|nr:Plasmodium exported protein, unknown function [Plasmodium vivax]
MNFVIKGNSKWFSLINIVTLVLFVWIHLPKYNKSNFGNFIGKKNSDVKILDLVLHRSLSKHVFNEEPERGNLKERLTYDRYMKSAKTGWEEKPTSNMLKKGEFSQLEMYKKNYRKRYVQKKGLKKLDCYWEEKIFDKIEHISILAEKSKSRKKRFIKKILNKYTIFLFLFALLPFLGVIIPELFDHEKPQDRFFKLVFGTCTKPKDENPLECKNGYNHISPSAGWAMFYINEIITGTLHIVFIFMIFYITVKYIKYDFLKAGKGNITLKEYFRLLKNKF